jgi:hypothetical protein
MTGLILKANSEAKVGDVDKKLKNRKKIVIR